MNPITTKPELLERIKDLKAVEVLARNSYEEDLATFNNFEIKNTIKKIKEDKDLHISMLDELIKLVEQGF